MTDVPDDVAARIVAAVDASEKGEQMDEATAKRIAEGLIKYGWFDKGQSVNAAWRGRLRNAIQECAEPEPIVDAEFMARAEAECGEAWVRHWNEMWRAAFDTEKGEHMAAIDDATAKRIARRLRDAGLAHDLRAVGDDGLAPLMAVIQDAAEPPPESPNPTLAPGLYFIRHDGGVHLEQFGIHADGIHDGVGWQGCDEAPLAPRPHGDIISGPHGTRALLAGVLRA